MAARPAERMQIRTTRSRTLFAALLLCSVRAAIVEASCLGEGSEEALMGLSLTGELSLETGSLIFGLL
jgi:hypothetical protein